MNQIQPRVFAVAGIPGAGKTTFVQKHIQTGILPANAFIHDCDAVMQNLAGYQNDLKQQGAVFAFTQWEMPARYLAEEALLQAVHEKKDIIYDRSCALPNSLIFLEELVNKHSYELHFYFLEIDMALAQQRTQEREKQTGRHIPISVIEQRLQSLQQLLPAYKKLASVWHQFTYTEQDKTGWVERL